MIAQVYYHKTMNFGGKRLPEVVKREDYQHLTQLRISSEEGAFISLNSGASSNDLLYTLGCRSMSVGDVVEIGERVMLCDMDGWKKVTWVADPFTKRKRRAHGEK